MIYIFRILLIFSIVNLINLCIYGGGVGMELVWIIIIISLSILSINKVHSILFSKIWIKIIFGLGLLIFLFVESSIIANGFKTNIDKKSDYIIVLGARVKGYDLSLALKYRLDKAYEYLTNNKGTKAILSGGKGKGENISEAEAMSRYLFTRGISKDRLILEDKSTNTDENIINSFEIINKYNKHANVIAVTSRFHILRSKMIAKDNGKSIEGIGVKTKAYLVPSYYLREFFAVVLEFIT
jgi:uncharacterized SAM-binding protein YcdF (DUF218 family)